MNTLKIKNITDSDYLTEKIMDLAKMFEANYGAKILTVEHVNKTVIIECSAENFSRIKQRFEQFQFSNKLFGAGKEQDLEITEF